MAARRYLLPPLLPPRMNLLPPVAVPPILLPPLLPPKKLIHMRVLAAVAVVAADLEPFHKPTSGCPPKRKSARYRSLWPMAWQRGSRGPRCSEKVAPLMKMAAGLLTMPTLAPLKSALTAIRTAKVATSVTPIILTVRQGVRCERV